MEILKCIEAIAVIIGNLFVCAGVIVAIRQLTIYKQEQSHKKKQSTVEFYHKVRNDFIKSLRKIETNCPEDQDIDVNKVKGDKATLDAIEEYLSHMERFSVGVNAGIYDIDLFKRTVGACYTKKWYCRLKEMIEYLRGKFDNRNIYKELEKLVCDLEKAE